MEYEKLADERAGEPSAAIKARVQAARERQEHRFRESERLHTNADMGPADPSTLLRTGIRVHSKLDQTGQNLLLVLSLPKEGPRWRN